MTTQNNTQAVQKAEGKMPLSQQITSRLLGKLQELRPNIVITEKMQRLMTNYFIGINQMLELQEKKREGNAAEYNWNNVDMADLAINIINKARLGLDILLPNHVHAIPYWNTAKKKYTINLMPGYVGIKNMAMTYAADPPKDAVVRLVHETDHFVPMMRDHRYDHDTYEFEIKQPFNRGAVVGGFGYLVYDDPCKNTLILMSNEDIEKRKPAKASANFWGTWNTEMKLKTLYREVFNSRNVPLDSSRLDDAYYDQVLRESEFARLMAQEDIDNNQLKEVFDVQSIKDDEPLPSMPTPASIAPVQEPSHRDAQAEEQMMIDDLANMPALPFSME